jgi:circadian clock protein KaiC
LLRYFETAGELRRAISVVKKRSGQHESTLRELRMGPEGLWVGEPLADFHGILTGTPTHANPGNGHGRNGGEHG